MIITKIKGKASGSLMPKNVFRNPLTPIKIIPTTTQTTSSLRETPSTLGFSSTNLLVGILIINQHLLSFSNLRAEHEHRNRPQCQLR